MHQDFAAHCDHLFSWDPQRTLVLGCSGGIDSVVLAHLVHQYHGSMVLAHLNYGLRGDQSDQDEAFVRDLAQELGCAVAVKRVDPTEIKDRPGHSVQMMARDMRYAFFEEVRAAHKAQAVLTGHHMDDDLETFFLNFSRGTGLKGLTGIQPKNGTLHRPLLLFTREQIYRYAQDRGYTWREDQSNQQDHYQRNYIRHHVVPGLKGLERPWDKALKTTQAHLSQAEILVGDYLNHVMDQVIEATEDGLVLNLNLLGQWPNDTSLLSAILLRFGLNAGQDVTALISSQSGHQWYTETHVLLKDRGVILINPLEALPKSEQTESWLIPSPDETPVPSVAVSKDVADKIELPRFEFTSVNRLTKAGADTIYVPTQMLEFPLKLRRWKKGDVFYPFGGPGKKKISKFFKDERLSLVRKKKTWLLACGDRIIWVVGLRADERFRVPENCKNITRIRVSSQDS